MNTRSNGIGEFSAELYALMRDVCPDCGESDGWYEGPRGAACLNVYCCNPACRAGFNIVPMVRLAQRIGKCTMPYPGEAPRWT